MKGIKADIEEEGEYLGPTRDSGHALRNSYSSTSLGERCPARIPQFRQWNRRVVCESRNPMRKNEPPTPVRTRLLLMRVAAMHNQCRPIESLIEESRVGVDLEFTRHRAVAIGKHAISGDDR